MGKIKQGILGPVSGKVGSVIGAVWKGIAYIRGIAAGYTDAKTPAQLAQRAKFAAVSAFIQPLSEFLQIGFRAYANGMTGINAAFAYNIRNALTGVYPDFAVDYPNALVARGTLPAPLNQVAASTVADTVLLTWDDNSADIGALATDKSLIVLFNPVKHQGVTVSELAERADGTQTVTVPSSWSGDLIQAYLAFKAEVDGTVSNSGFAGAVTVA